MYKSIQNTTLVSQEIRPTGNKENLIKLKILNSERMLSQTAIKSNDVEANKQGVKFPVLLFSRELISTKINNKYQGNTLGL